jgi:hypothetical protein
MNDRLPKYSLIKNLLLVSSTSIAMIALLGLVGIWRTGSRFIDAIEEFLHPSLANSQIDVPTLIIDRVRGVSELTTATFVMEAVVPTSQERKLGDLVVATTKLLYIAQGEVKAGIDLNKLTQDDVKLVNNILEIQLPPPQILDRKIDIDRSRVYDYDRGLLGLGPDVAPDLQTLAQRQTLAKIVSAACNRGLLEEANQKADLAVTQLLTTAGYQVKVKTTPPNPETCS